MSDDNYRLGHSYKSRHKLLKHSKWFAVGLLLAIPVLIAGMIFTGVILISPKAAQPTSDVQTSLQAPSIKVFRSSYFQFQTGKSWSEDAKETSDNKYVYRSYRGPLLEHELTIYVNAEAPEFDVVRVQPVKPKDNGTFEVTEGISEHCQLALPEGQRNRIQTVSFNGVTIPCRADGTNFDVVVGEIGDDPYILLKRPDGSTAQYLIIYKDLTATPTGQELNRIAQTFQAR